ncbi:hypothetical protein KASHIRA_01450 [Serratia phage vB_SmaM-Kashira]|nr:hypothetical protein [Acinetobacter phage ABPH49]URC22719.1 hypothetical protein KASHIRA_01450 [Serratia phage vB_SmaM-Kashira]
MTRQEALNYVATELAAQAVRHQRVAAQQTLDFLSQIDPTGDPDLEKKIQMGKEELALFSSQKFLRALEYLYAEIYDGLEDKHLIRFAEEVEYELAVSTVGALNAARVGELVDQLINGTYVAPTIQ